MVGSPLESFRLAHPLPYYPDGVTEKTEPAGGFGAIVLAALPAQAAEETVTIYGWEDALQAYINSDEYQEGDPIGVVFSPEIAGNFEVRTYRSREHASAADPQPSVDASKPAKRRRLKAGQWRAPDGSWLARPLGV